MRHLAESKSPQVKEKSKTSSWILVVSLPLQWTVGRKGDRAVAFD
jgi:hypothetical protein